MLSVWDTLALRLRVHWIPGPFHLSYYLLNCIYGFNFSLLCCAESKGSCKSL